MKCDHIVGESVGVDESWLTRLSKSGQDKDYLETRFNFCPDCGMSLKGIKLKRRPPYKPDDVSPAMQRLSDEAGKMLVSLWKRHAPPRRSFNNPEPFTREIGTCPPTS